MDQEACCAELEAEQGGSQMHRDELRTKVQATVIIYGLDPLPWGVTKFEHMALQ